MILILIALLALYLQIDINIRIFAAYYLLNKNEIQ